MGGGARAGVEVALPSKFRGGRVAPVALSPFFPRPGNLRLPPNSGNAKNARPAVPLRRGGEEGMEADVVKACRVPPPGSPGKKRDFSEAGEDEPPRAARETAASPREPGASGGGGDSDAVEAEEVACPRKWFKQAAASDQDERATTGPADVEHDGHFHGTRCTIPPCRGSRSFDDPEEYELHYRVRHCFVCDECPGGVPRLFPDKRTLELHFTECHDPFFEARKARGDTVFQCLVIGCTKAFHTAKGRRLHLIDKHKYPRTFDFKVVHLGVLPYVCPGYEGRSAPNGRDRKHKPPPPPAAGRERSEPSAGSAARDETGNEDGSGAGAGAGAGAGDGAWDGAGVGAGDGAGVGAGGGAGVGAGDGAGVGAGAGDEDAMDITPITKSLSRLSVRAPEHVVFGRGRKSLPGNVDSVMRRAEKRLGALEKRAAGSAPMDTGGS
ncbi:MAG: hypothetical protein BJ554DRAFT_5552, partial [Olpidium bornovanus]